MAQGQERGDRGSDDMKAREYRGENGEIHHHTKKYMETHEGEAGRSDSGASGRSREDRGASGQRSRSESDGGRSFAPSGGERDSGGGARTTTDHDEIRRWAEAHGGKPAAVARTHKGGDVGIVRIMFPDAPNSEHDALTEISWDEFFKEFELRKLALLYDPDSLFSKIIGRDTADKRAHGDHKAAR